MLTANVLPGELDGRSVVTALRLNAGCGIWGRQTDGNRARAGDGVRLAEPEGCSMLAAGGLQAPAIAESGVQ